MQLLNVDFLERLKLVNDKLTNSELYIADKLANNSTYFSKKSISEVSQSLNVSNSTISRFAQKLGYSGFVELKHALFTIGTSELDENSNLKIQYSLLLNDYIRLMSRFISNTDFKVIKSIARKMHKAHRIIVLGLGNSGNIAREFSTNLTFLGIDTATGIDYDSVLILSRHCKPSDFVIFFSNSGTTDCIQEGISYCLKNNSDGLLITSNNSLEDLKIDCLVLPSNRDYISDTYLSNHIPQLFVTDILYRELIKISPDNYNKSLEATALLFK